MHLEAKHFVDWTKTVFPSFFHGKDVLDVGGGDINGNNRYLFESCNYNANDVCEAPNVTIVSKTSQLPYPNNTFDTIISTECFEHDPEYKQSILKIEKMLKPGGLFVFTCASTGREEHGTRRTTPNNSYASHLEEFQDYYNNLSEGDIHNIFDFKFKEFFSTWNFYYNSKSHDLYFIGFKKNLDSNEKIEISKYLF